MIFALGTQFHAKVRFKLYWRTRNGPHAVYVDSYEEGEGGYVFHCINSWGPGQDPAPAVPCRDVLELHFISLYAKPSFVLASSGPSAEAKGVNTLLGLYEQAGVQEGCVFYRQLDTLAPAQEAVLAFRSANTWYIGTSLGDTEGARLMSEGGAGAEAPPAAGWRYRPGARWLPDPLISLELGTASLCSGVEISGSGAAAQSPCLGSYSPTLAYSAGRQVFKHTDKELYLLGKSQ